MDWQTQPHGIANYPAVDSRVSSEGLYRTEAGTRDCRTLPHTPILATTVLPSPRSGQIPLDDSDQSLATSKYQRRYAPTPDQFPPGTVIGFPPEWPIAFSGILIRAQVRNNALKQHPALVDREKLSEDDKKDRSSTRHLPKLIKRASFRLNRIVQVKSGGPAARKAEPQILRIARQSAWRIGPLRSSRLWMRPIILRAGWPDTGSPESTPQPPRGAQTASRTTRSRRASGAAPRGFEPRLPSRPGRLPATGPARPAV